MTHIHEKKIRFIDICTIVTNIYNIFPKGQRHDARSEGMGRGYVTFWFSLK